MTLSRSQMGGSMQTSRFPITFSSPIKSGLRTKSGGRCWRNCPGGWRRIVSISRRQPGLDATKDQYRLTTQALLAERFRLKLHFEQRELPVLAMALAKPGRSGPKLIPHEQGQSCDEKPKPEAYPKESYGVLAMPAKNGIFLFGSRAISMALIADFLGDLVGRSGDIGRRVVDQTGLTGCGTLPWMPHR